VTAAGDHDLAIDAARAMDMFASGDSPASGLSVAGAMTSILAGLRHYADRHHIDYAAVLAASHALHASQRVTGGGHAPGTHIRPRATAAPPGARLASLGVITAVDGGLEDRSYRVQFPGDPTAVVLADSDIEAAQAFPPAVTAQGMITTLAGAEQSLTATAAAVRAHNDKGLPPAWAAISDQGRLAAAIGAVHGLSPGDVLRNLRPALSARKPAQAPAPPLLATQGFPHPHCIPTGSLAGSSLTGSRTASHAAPGQAASTGPVP
jgi:hypothetical protein